MKRRRFLGTLGSAAGALALRPASSDALAVEARSQQTTSPPRPALQFRLPPDFAYLNTAGLGASPTAVIDAVTARMDREEQNPAPGHNEDDWKRIRAACAALLGPRVRAEDVAFMSTATEGINAVLNTLALGPGDQIITSTHEHAGLVIPLLHKMQTAGCVIRTFEPDTARAEGNIDRIAALITGRTRLIFVSHVTCTTGQLMPAAGIGALARDRGVTFALDGAQSLGHLPFDIGDTLAHYYAASCHKWVMGPKRTGLLYVRPDCQTDARPGVVGAYSDQTSSLPDRTLVLRPNAQRFEYGTQNNALIYGLEAAVDLVTGLGLEALWRRNRALAERCRAGLLALEGVEILSPADAASRTAILTFRLAGRDNRAVASSLAGRRLRVRSVTEAGLDAVRASFHVCNDGSHVDRLVAAVAALASAG